MPHVQDPDRVRGALELERAGVDVIVLDDGFQHRRLARDLDLVLVDATRPFGLPSLAPRGAPSNAVRALLPRGLLREPPRALARADGLVITRCDAIDTQELRALHAELAAFAPGRPIAHAAHRPVGLRRLRGSSGGGATHGLEWLAGRTVDLVSGIGNPDAFQRTVAGLGAHIGDHRRFPDHHPFAPRELAGLGARPVLVTAKDAARISGDVDPWPDQPGLEVLVLDIALEVVHGAAELDSLLAGLPEAPARRARDASHAGLHG